MSTTEEQRLVEAAVAARESETAGWPGSVDDVVAGRLTAKEMMDAILARETKSETE